jgi:hypothetical protein
MELLEINGRTVTTMRPEDFKAALRTTPVTVKIGPPQTGNVSADRRFSGEDLRQQAADAQANRDAAAAQAKVEGAQAKTDAEAIQAKAEYAQPKMDGVAKSERQQSKATANALENKADVQVKADAAAVQAEAQRKTDATKSERDSVARDAAAAQKKAADAQAQKDAAAAQKKAADAQAQKDAAAAQKEAADAQAQKDAAATVERRPSKSGEATTSKPKKTRTEIWVEIFTVLDAKKRGRLRAAQLFPVCKLMGFPDPYEQFPDEYNDICGEYEVDPKVGFDQSSFLQFVDDQAASVKTPELSSFLAKIKASQSKKEDKS